MEERGKKFENSLYPSIHVELTLNFFKIFENNETERGVMSFAEVMYKPFAYVHEGIDSNGDGQHTHTHSNMPKLSFNFKLLTIISQFTPLFLLDRSVQKTDSLTNLTNPTQTVWVGLDKVLVRIELTFYQIERFGSSYRFIVKKIGSIRPNPKLNI